MTGLPGIRASAVTSSTSPSSSSANTTILVQASCASCAILCLAAWTRAAAMTLRMFRHSPTLEPVAPRSPS